LKIYTRDTYLANNRNFELSEQDDEQDPRGNDRFDKILRQYLRQVRNKGGKGLDESKFQNHRIIKRNFKNYEILLTKRVRGDLRSHEMNIFGSSFIEAQTNQTHFDKIPLF